MYQMMRVCSVVLPRVDIVFGAGAGWTGSKVEWCGFFRVEDKVIYTEITLFWKKSTD
jgi:hypothetical protein